MRTRVGTAMLGLVALAVAGTALTVHRQHEKSHEKSGEAVDRGSLTSSEYHRAVAIARSEIARDHATVSTAVAYLVAGSVQDPNLRDDCRSGHLLVVTLVGDFPDIVFGTGFAGEGAPQGPDHWVTIKSDPATGEECSVGVSVGRFTASSGDADLSPAL